MTKKLHPKLFAVLCAANALLLVACAVAVFCYGYYEKKKVADLMLRSQINNLITQNFAAAKSEFSVLKTVFSRITIYDGNSAHKMLEVSDRLIVPVTIIQKLSTNERTSQNYASVAFTYEGFWFIVVGLLCATGILGVFNSLFYYAARVYAKQEHYKAKIAPTERFNYKAVQVAHDIRSPLSVLNAFAVNASPESEDARLIALVAKRINQIAEDLLASSRDANTESTFDLAKIISQITDEKRALLNPRESIGIKFNLDETIVKGNATDIARVFSNVIDNSRDAKVEWRDLNICIEKVSSDKFVDIRLRDNGKGIHQSDLQLIGSLGFTTKRSDVKTGNGVGINSAIDILRRFGGDLFITSTLDVETVVTLRFRRPEIG